MKSRKFTITNSAETTGSIARGLLVVRAPQSNARGAVAAGSAVRHFELQHNQSPRFARRRQERRKGQALLLAVLIMLLAALLSAGFLAVVSGNLNQTARVADKTRAIEASRAGIAYANAQLSGSAQGDLWRPIDVSPAPDTGSTNPDYNTYYSQLDKVQGWAAKRQPKTTDNFPNATYNVATYDEAAAIYRSITYGKFPDPNQVASDAPKFLVKVREVPSNITDPDYEKDHVGEIKITSIGLSEDDPNVFHRAVAYKVGRAKSPFTQALRSVSNWDFRNDQGGVPFARVNTAAAAGASNMAPATNVAVQVNTRVAGEEAPKFSAEDVPFNVVIVKKDLANPSNSTVNGAVVTAMTNVTATTATLTLAKVEAPIDVNEIIQKAASIGTGSTIDLLNTGAPTSVAATFPNYTQPNGILVNGSLWLQNQVLFSNLSKDGTKLFTSGSLAIDNSAANVNKPVLPGGDVDVSGGGNGNQIVPSNVEFPGNNIVLTAAATSNGVEKADLVNDGWNKIGAVKTLGLEYIPDQTRTVEPFTPVKIDSAQNLARYRALTRNSADGIYIDNRGDVEKIGTAPMSQADLMKMWASEAATATEFYLRNSTAGGASLEEKHLRGWIGPDEFLARGALVELIQTTGANPYIRVTYDARSDAIFNGPDPAKAFRGADGALQRGVYSKNIVWPKNGTLFAEGNIRIRGKVNLSNLTTGTDAADFPSLTVVSQNNIYIEGGVSVDDSVVGGNPAATRKKLMLLAKKNVVVNPTRLVLGHVDEQTVSANTADAAATGTAPNQSIIIPVEDASPFKVGDVIETFDTPAATVATVRGIVSARDTTTTPNTLTASLLKGTTVPPTSAVKTLLTDTVTPTAPVTKKFFKADTENAIERRVLLQDAAAKYLNLRLTLDHLAERKRAITIETEGSGGLPKPATLSVKVTNKRIDANGTFDINNPYAQTDNKRINAVFNLPTAGVDVFPDQTAYPFSDPDPAITENAARGYSLVQLETDLNAVAAKVDPATMPAYAWKYKGTKEPTLPTDMPFFYLAGIGLRIDEPAATPPVTVADGVDIGPTTFEIPLAASVRVERNGTPQSLTTLYNTQPNGTPPVADQYNVRFFGFNPLHGIVGVANADADEDALTVDQSFYQANTDAGVLKSVLDSRKTNTNFATEDVLVLRQNNDLLAGTTPIALPEYRVRALKLENTDLGLPATPPATPIIQPIDLDIDAYVYAQEGSWFVIPGDYFRDGNAKGTPNSNPIRSDAAGTATYIDANNSGDAQTGEYVDVDGDGNLSAGDFADLNRNGILDPGEAEAALRFVRYNYKVNFYGAIIENQTAVVADVKDAAGTNTLVNGAVQDWTDKWVAYNNDNNNNGIADNSAAETDPNVNNVPKFKFITYAYDPSLALATPTANQLRVPITDDLIYQQ